MVIDKSPVLQHEHHFQDRPSFTEDWHRFTASQARRSNGKEKLRANPIALHWCVFESLGDRKGQHRPRPCHAVAPMRVLQRGAPSIGIKEMKADTYILSSKLFPKL